MLEEMDEEFGIGALVDEAFGSSKKQVGLIFESLTLYGTDQQMDWKVILLDSQWMENILEQR